MSSFFHLNAIPIKKSPPKYGMLKSKVSSTGTFGQHITYNDGKVGKATFIFYFYLPCNQITFDVSRRIDSLFARKFDIENIEEVYNKLGNKTSKGIDKIGHYVFEKGKSNTFNLINIKVLNGSYKFSCYLENLKSKGRNKFPRVISIPTIRDRIVLSIIKDILHDIFPECVNKKLPNKYIADIKKFNNSIPAVYFFQTDIMQFYDKIDRTVLLSILESKIKNTTLLELIKTALNNITIPHNVAQREKASYACEFGVPQGLAISNVLAHIYLSDFDLTISKRNLLYLRYVDDILILTDKPLATYRIENIKTHLAAKNLAIHGDEKTFSGKLTTDINYLGYKINSQIVSIAEKNIQTFIFSIASLFTHYRKGFSEKSMRRAWLTDDDTNYNIAFIEDLNEKITGSRDLNKSYGWMFFFSEITDRNLLFRLDKIINSFFLKLDSFENKAPGNLKRLVRTFYEIKYNPKSGYINDYNLQNTPKKKLEYLIFRGYLNPSIEYSVAAIEALYNRFKKKQLRKLEKDVGYSYF